MIFKNFRGKLFENGKRYAKSETTTQKALEKRILNHILHVQFERKTSVSQSICCTHNMCINTQNDRKCQKASKCLLRYGTESNDTSSYILLDHSNAFNLSGGNFLSRTSLPEPILSGEGGNFQLFPLLRPPCILTGPNWHMHNLAMGPSIEDHNWVSMVFSYRGDAITRFT